MHHDVGNSFQMTVVCTITSRTFHAGTAVLINSLAKAGFKGRIIVAYVGSLPEWSETAQVALERFEIKVEFLKLAEDRLVFYHKASTLKHCAETFRPKKLFLIDSDIVIRKRWDFFETWVECGIAVCADINYINMQNDHPLRNYWRNLLISEGYNVYNRTGYANSGFIGLNENCFEIIDIWHHLIETKSKERGMNSKTGYVFGQGFPEQGFQEHGFATFDQDLLNAAMMATNMKMSIVGHEGMSFNNVLGYMVHAIGTKKPWQRGFLWNLIRNGKGLPLTARQFWRHTDGPIEVFNPVDRKIAEIEMNITAALSRLIAR